jgi:hypothetical protein
MGSRSGLAKAAIKSLENVLMVCSVSWRDGGGISASF